MFHWLGSFASKYRLFIVAFWVVLTAAMVLTAPKLSQVGITDQSQFLPENSESSFARELLNTKFSTTNQSSVSSALVVVYNEKGLTQQDMGRAKNLHDWLVSPQAPGAVSRVISIFETPALSSSLMSQDNTTMLMTVDMSVPALDDATKRAVEEIRAKFDKQPGAVFYLTGNDGLLYDLFASVQQTIDRTTLVTIILVIILLLIVYRSPVAALMPLVAIGFSFLTARGIVGFLAQAGMPVSTVNDAYLVVTIFGVGTDYCLFIVSRFREELGHGGGHGTLEYTMRRISPIILASAITVIAAFACLTISRFGMTRTSGWSLAIGIAVTLAAGLTLVPALMSLFGRHLFWPAKVQAAHKPGRFGWNNIGRWVAGHPLVTVAAIIVLLALPYSAYPGLKLSANTLSQIPQNVESAQGLNVVREHFPVGEQSPLYLMIQSNDGPLLNQGSRLGIQEVAKSLSNVSDIARVDYFSAPAGPLIQSGQQVRSLGDMLSSGTPDLNRLTSLQSLSGDLQTLAVRYPGVIQSANFNKSSAILASLPAMLAQLRTASPAEQPKILPQLQASLYSLADALTSLGNEFELNVSSPFTGWLQAQYFSTDGTIARVNLVLKTDPFSDAATLTVDQVREATAAAISTSALKGDAHYIGGDAAIHTDMLQTSETDFLRVLVIASIGILLVIIVLLRCLLAPLYMVATVLFNFGATVGITTWLFLDVLKVDSLIYLLPVFVFVMLVAVGADYNIFLVSRIREEAEKAPMGEAVQRAVANTGGVITSCGIILAGTFATLASSPLPMVLQIGVPIAMGVLIDTFLVRSLLVPSLAKLAGRWSWWPSGLFRKLGGGG